MPGVLPLTAWMSLPIMSGAQHVEQGRELARRIADVAHDARAAHAGALAREDRALERLEAVRADDVDRLAHLDAEHELGIFRERLRRLDRKSTRLNSSHSQISY